MKIFRGSKELFCVYRNLAEEKKIKKVIVAICRVKARNHSFQSFTLVQ